jgi:uncharacterized protein (DUF433 family)
MSTPAEVDIGTLIRSLPGVNGGRPCIVGTGTSVQHISVMFNSGMSAAEIAAELPHIPSECIYAALAYYVANREAVDLALAEDEANASRLSFEHEAKHKHSH